MAGSGPIAIQALGSERVLVALQSDFDVRSSREIKDSIYRELESGRRYLILNLERVRYIDSTGLGSLLSILRRVREREGNMVLVCNHPYQRNVFKVTGLDRVFEFVADNDEAARVVIATPAV